MRDKVNNHHSINYYRCSQKGYYTVHKRGGSSKMHSYHQAHTKSYSLIIKILNNQKWTRRYTKALSEKVTKVFTSLSSENNNTKTIPLTADSDASIQSANFIWSTFIYMYNHSHWQKLHKKVCDQHVYLSYLLIPCMFH